MSKEKFKKYFELDNVESLMIKIRVRAIYIEVTTEINVCRHTKDISLLSLAKYGNAIHLLTGDKDLLILKKFDKTKILTIVEYLVEE